MRTSWVSPTVHTSTRASVVETRADEAWAVVVDGGPHAWHVDALPLVVRGGLDRLVGGAGRRRPAPDAGPLAVGDRPGLWRVESLREPGLLTRGELRLRALVRAPGVVTLTTAVEPLESGCRIVQSVRLDPHGLLGRAYLAADLPAREVVIELVHRRLLAALR